MTFRMPAEWEPHAATWIAWPHERSDWPGKFEPIQWVYAEIVRKLTRVERVRILVQDAAVTERARKMLGKVEADLDAVDFFEHPTDRAWTRDYCPLFVKNRAGEIAITDWEFNGWAKYPNHTRDNAVPRLLAERRGMRRFVPGMVLEGGSIDVNGAGLLLTTEECLLSEVQQRNPGKSRKQIEAALKTYLGVKRVIWLDRGIVGDDTHGHVDDLARFVSKDTVVVASEADKSDENYGALRDAALRLRAAGLRVIKLPMPRPVWFNGQRLPASYANFYIANGLVLVPTFNDPADRSALATLARCFPDREVCGIHAVDLVWGLGTLHCMTQQEPAGVSSLEP